MSREPIARLATKLKLDEAESSKLQECFDSAIYAHKVLIDPPVLNGQSQVEPSDGNQKYGLDLSSVFEVLPAYYGVPNNIQSVIDLCSAPGGKSILLSRKFESAKFFCNEYARARVARLRHNLAVHHGGNFEVTHLDMRTLASRYSDSADLVVVDPPCSGQTLVMKGKESKGCFSKYNIDRSVKIQRLCVSSAAECVVSGGFILYSTCTFSVEENEKVIEWALKKFPDLESVEVVQLGDFQSSLTAAFAYRLYPWQGWGVGGFTALLRRKPRRA
ncbi:MAG: hypothetical protein COT74_02570 [Bdellovibrionales bacterium CG10_big_fil_rev_8_21_14_0_10_45_34]|nr:MAG: hypothetical protein COT74_02570 [Bdellovibrionales bacterium CG10_big_fil_rev_8_21_14_0_10_45_34]